MPEQTVITGNIVIKINWEILIQTGTHGRWTERPAEHVQNTNKVPFHGNNPILAY